MSIGGMRHKLKIQSTTRTSDDGGGASRTYANVATVFGSIEPESGSERFFGDQLEGVVTHIITIRFRRGITHANRIVYEYIRSGQKYTRIFNVKRVINKDTKDKFLELLCQEGVAT